MTAPAPRLHLEWGPAGAALVSPGTIAAVVDVLSFTTTVSIAADLGIEVLPHPLDGDAAGLASRAGAVLAAPRGGPGPTLSPASLRTAEPVPSAWSCPRPTVPPSPTECRLPMAGRDAVPGG